MLANLNNIEQKNKIKMKYCLKIPHKEYMPHKKKAISPYWDICGNFELKTIIECCFFQINLLFYLIICYICNQNRLI